MVALQQDIQRNGMNQGDLVRLLENTVALANELRTDYTALLADVTAIRSALVATHAKMDSDSGINDTNYAATNDPAALTATAIAASALTLSKG